MTADRRPAPADALLAVAVGLAAIGAVLGAVQVARTGWTPSSDQAFIEMRVRDVPGDPPLLGVFSRYGWSHPGPAMFYLLAVPYRLAGSASEALAAASLVAHVAVVGAATWLARRIDRWAGVAVFVALGSVLLAAGAAATRDPWNPWVALVASGLLVVVAWGTGERQAIPAALLLPTGTVLVQSHAAGGPLVVAVTAAAGMALWWSGPGAGSRSDQPSESTPAGPSSRPVPWAALGAGAAVSAVAWIPPVVAQLRGEPGRIGELFQAGTGTGARAGLQGAVGVLTGTYALVPSWLGGAAREPFTSTDWSVPVWLVVPIVGLVVAARRGERTWVRGLIVSLVAVVAVAIGVATFEVGVLDGRDVVFSYLTVALRAPVALSVALGAAATATALAAPAAERVRVAAGALAVVIAVAFIALQASSATPVPTIAPLVRTLSTAVLDSPVAADPLVLVDAESYPGAEGVLLALERSGVDVVVDRPDFVTRVGPSRIRPDDEAAGSRVELLVTAPDRAADLRRDGWTVVAVCGPGLAADGEETLGGLVAVRRPVGAPLVAPTAPSGPVTPSGGAAACGP